MVFVKGKGGNTAGTSHLKQHLKMHQKARSCCRNLNKYAYNKDIASNKVVGFIIIPELPFTFVEKHDFIVVEIHIT